MLQMTEVLFDKMGTYQDHVNRLPEELLYELFAGIARISDPHPYFDSENKVACHNIETTLSTLHALSLTSQRFYRIVQQVLYHTIRLGDHTRRRKFFRTIVETPALIKHVKNVIFHPGIFYKPYSEPPPSDLSCFWATLQKLAPLIPDLAWQWYRRIKYGDPALELVCLLVRLENLRRFQLVAGDGTFNEHFLIFVETVYMYIPPGPGCYFLTRLEEFCIDLQDASFVTTIRAFLPIKNLRMLYRAAPSIKTLAMDKYYELSNIGDLRFLASNISPDILKFSLQQVAALEVLHYDFSADIEKSDLQSFRLAVNIHERTLKALRLTAQFDQWKKVRHKLYNQHIWCFRGYSALTHLEVPDLVLVRETSKDVDMDESFPLPLQLEELVITACLDGKKTLTFLITLVSDCKSSPVLRKVTLRGQRYSAGPHLNKLLSDLSISCHQGEWCLLISRYITAQRDRERLSVCHRCEMRAV